MLVSLKKKFHRLERLNNAQLKELFVQKQRDFDLMCDILDGIGLFILVFDIQGTIIHLNRAMERFLQQKKSQVINKSVMEIFTHKSIQAIFKKVLFHKEKVYGEEIGVDKASFQIGRVQVFPVTEEGKISQYIFILQDATEEKTKELKNIHQKSIHSLAVLTAGIAHEIKNPLGSLDLHMQLIQRFIRDKKIPNKKTLFELTQVVEEEIKRLDKIVNDFLFSVRPIKARMKPENPNNILKEIYTLIKPEFDKENILLKLELSDKDLLYPMDKDHLKQALLNLIANAKNACGDKKKEHWVALRCEWEKQYLVLSVEDNGVGIDKEVQAKIFDPFYTSSEKGTGLGLTIVYKIISEHDGEIVLSSEMKRGSLFRIELP